MNKIRNEDVHVGLRVQEKGSERCCVVRAVFTDGDRPRVELVAEQDRPGHPSVTRPLVSTLRDSYVHAPQAAAPNGPDSASAAPANDEPTSDTSASIAVALARIATALETIAAARATSGKTLPLFEIARTA